MSTPKTTRIKTIPKSSRLKAPLPLKKSKSQALPDLAVESPDIVAAEKDPGKKKKKLSLSKKETKKVENVTEIQADIPIESAASKRKATAAVLPESLKLARRCVELVMDKKALEPVILDLTELSTITDYFVICSAQSEPQLKAIANGLEKTLKDDDDVRPFAVDGFPTSQWIVVDYGTVMVHIFHESRRPIYALEDLWSDAPRLAFN